MSEKKENKYVADDNVYAKVNPDIRLVLRQHVSRIYYCRFPYEPNWKELALFEQEPF